MNPVDPSSDQRPDETNSADVHAINTAPIQPTESAKWTDLITKLRIRGFLVGLAGWMSLLLTFQFVSWFVYRFVSTEELILIGIVLLLTHRLWSSRLKSFIRTQLSVLARQVKAFEVDWMTAFGCLAVLSIVFNPIQQSSSRVPPQQVAQNPSHSVVLVSPPDPRAKIESVLNADAQVTAGATTAAQVVTRMRAIKLDECPIDLQDAYLAHIHVWESMAVFEKKAQQLSEHSKSGDAAMEAFLRGFTGDPWGKMNEMKHDVNKLKEEFESISLNMKQTFNSVERIAVRYGARLPVRMASDQRSGATAP